MTLGPTWLKQLAELFAHQKGELFLVGGAVRDHLLKREIGEWDLTTSLRPKETEELLKEFKCTHINLVGQRFGTVMAEFMGEKIEVTTFRSDTYHETSRQPIVSYGHSLTEDLSRRDFTINALAYDILKEKIIDPHQGQIDLKHKIIRAVGDPVARFDEDPLRMLRAIRFQTTLGFSIEESTLRAIVANKSRLAILSAERIAQELDKILLAEEPSVGLSMLVETGLINYILPELLPSLDLKFDPRDHKDIYRHILQVTDNTTPKLELRWCGVLHDLAKPLTRKKIEGQYYFIGHEVVGSKMAKTILTRLKYPSEFVNYVAKLVYLHQRLPNYDGHWTDGGIRRFVRDAGECLNDLFLFAEADATGSNEKKLAGYRLNREKLQKRIAELEAEAEIAKIKSPLSGEELMALFHRPAGPWIKPIKEHLLSLVLDGKLKESDKAEATTIAKKLLKP